MLQYSQSCYEQYNSQYNSHEQYNGQLSFGECEMVALCNDQICFEVIFKFAVKMSLKSEQKRYIYYCNVCFGFLLMVCGLLFMYRMSCFSSVVRNHVSNSHWSVHVMCFLYCLLQPSYLLVARWDRADLNASEKFLSFGIQFDCWKMVVSIKIEEDLNASLYACLP